MTFAPLSYKRAVVGRHATIRDLFDLDSVYWEVDLVDGDNFTVTPVAVGNTLQVNFRVETVVSSGFGIYDTEIVYSPEGGIADPSNPGLPSGAVKGWLWWDEGLPFTPNASAMHLHEWTDRFSLLSWFADTAAVPPVNGYAAMVCAGKHLAPFDPQAASVGVTGDLIAMGRVPVASGDISEYVFGDRANPTMYNFVRSGPGVWSRCGIYNTRANPISPGDGTTAAWSIGGRTQPIPCVLKADDVPFDENHGVSKRAVGTLKCFVGHYEASVANRIITGAAGEKAFVVERTSTSASSARWAHPMESTFDPTTI